MTITGRALAVPCQGSRLAGGGRGERQPRRRRWMARTPLDLTTETHLSRGMRIAYTAVALKVVATGRR